MPPNFRFPKCSVIIRCCNEEKHIGKLLHGITEQTLQDVEIVIVDSGSTDGTIDIASRYPAKIATISREEFSFGRSLNIGCKAASNDLIAIASAHVYPLYRDWLEKLLLPFQDPQIGLVYGQQRGERTTKFSEHQIFKKWFPDKSNLDQKNPFCNNANAAIRKSIWEKNQYNEEITGLEDLEWANRLLNAGHHLAYQSDAVVVHLHDENASQTYNRYRREAIALKRIFPDEVFDFKDFLRLFTFNTISDYKNALRDGVTARELYEIPLFRSLQFWGTYQGFKKGGSLTSQLKRAFYYPNDTRPKPVPTKSPPKNPLLIEYRSERRSYRENN